MKFNCIENHRNLFPVRMMCRLLSVSVGGYYHYRKRPTSNRDKEDNRLLQLIEKIHKGSRSTYGSPRIYQHLRGLGENCSRKRVEKLMKNFGIKAKSKRKFKATTNSKHNLPVYKNILDRNFNPKAPNQSWSCDITYLRTEEGWLYLAIVMDLYSRKIVGWAMEERMTRSLVQKALKMAVRARNPQPGLVLHSDRGSQYCSHDYQKLLDFFGFKCSMSRKGNCWDNAAVESFFGSLKTEHVFFERYSTREQAKQSVFEWIEAFYNRERIHSSLGFCSPEVYEQSIA